MWSLYLKTEVPFGFSSLFPSRVDFAQGPADSGPFLEPSPGETARPPSSTDRLSSWISGQVGDPPDLSVPPAATVGEIHSDV